MLKLSDDELAAIMAAAQPLPVGQREAFLQQVAAGLQSCGEVGPGIVHRVAARVQREMFIPPLEAAVGRRRSGGKYG